MIYDLSREIEARESLEKERFRLLDIIEKSVNEIYLLNSKSYKIEYANKGALLNIGYSIEEIQKLAPYDLTSISSKDEFEKLIEPLVKGKTKQLFFESYHVRKDGSIYPIEVTLQIIMQEQESLFLAIINDITEIHSAREKLKTSDRIFTHSVDMLSIIGIDGTLMVLNPSWEKILGWSIQELQKVPVVNFIHPDDLSCTKEALYSLAEGVELQQFQVRFRCRDGIYKWLSWNAFPYVTEGVVFLVSRDITLRKKMEDELRYREETIRLLFDSTAEGIYGIDLEGKCTFCNSSALKILGYTAEEEVIGENMHFLIHHTDINGVEYPIELCPIHRTILDGKGTHSESDVLWRKDGSRFIPEYWSYPIIRDNKIVGAVVTFIDITERKYNEEVQHILHEIARTSLLSEAIEDLMDVVKEELAKVMDTTGFFVHRYEFNTDSLTRVAFADETIDTGSWCARGTLSGKVISSGESLYLSEERIDSMIKSGEIFSESGNIKSWLGVPIKDRDKILGVMGVLSYQDSGTFDSKNIRLLEMIAYELTIVIQRSEMIKELIAEKERAEESDRLKTSFLSNVSHEIRTPMNGILGFLELLSEPDLESADKEMYMDLMRKSGSRLLSTINDIVEISKIESGQTSLNSQEIDICEIMLFHYNFFNPQASAKGLTLLLKDMVRDNSAFIIADKFKIDAVMTNLLSNAIKFTKEGVVEFGNFVKENKLFFYVKDTGIGIPLNKQSDVFNRFVQVDSNYSRPHEGSGLGLAIVKGYIEAMGGEIWTESEPEKYTKFIFYIPYIISGS